MEYNTRRPRSSLGYGPPVPVAYSPVFRPSPVSQPGDMGYGASSRSSCFTGPLTRTQVTRFNPRWSVGGSRQQLQFPTPLGFCFLSPPNEGPVPIDLYPSAFGNELGNLAEVCFELEGEEINRRFESMSTAPR